MEGLRRRDAPTLKREYGANHSMVSSSSTTASDHSASKRYIPYAFVFASKHCSPRICSSWVETPWINPSCSGTVSAGLKVGVFVVMVERKEGERDATRGAFESDEPRLAATATKEGTLGFRWTPKWKNSPTSESLVMKWCSHFIVLQVGLFVISLI